jgi:hypothetical protein
MPQPRRPVPADAVPVMVPRNARPLVPVTPDRVRRLRKHLVKRLHDARGLKAITSPSSPAPTGFAACVTHAACSLCKGWCCRNGGDDAFLDEQTMARVRRTRPDLDAYALLRLYSERVPALAFEDSCLFHGKQGCTLDRSLRADICNSYFCRGLGTYLTDRETETPRVVIAGEGNAMRTSRVLVPCR